MRFKDWKTRKDWDPIFPESHLSGDLLKEAEAACHEPRRRLLETLQVTLQEHHMLILCGSGTSFDLNTSPAPAQATSAEFPKKAPTMADLWKAVRHAAEAKEAGRFQKVLNYVNYTPAKDQENVENLLSCCLLSERFRSVPIVKEFLQMAKNEIAQKCRFPQVGEDLPVHETFLRRLAGRDPHLPRAKVFTTNYDLCFEQAATNSRFALVDGFSHTLPQVFDPAFFSFDWVRRDESLEEPVYASNVVQLYKLHGSVDWERTPSGVIKKPDTTHPLMIYPHSERNDLSLESPFLDIMSRFLVSLQQSRTTLLIIGFGFEQSHLSEPILKAIQSNVDLRVVVVLPRFDFANNPKLKAIKTMAEQGDTRLRLIESTFQELVRNLPDRSIDSTSPQENSRLVDLTKKAA